MEEDNQLYEPVGEDMDGASAAIPSREDLPIHADFFLVAAEETGPQVQPVDEEASGALGNTVKPMETEYSGHYEVRLRRALGTKALHGSEPRCTTTLLCSGSFETS